MDLPRRLGGAPAVSGPVCFRSGGVRNRCLQTKSTLCNQHIAYLRDCTFGPFRCQVRLSACVCAEELIPPTALHLGREQAPASLVQPRDARPSLRWLRIRLGQQARQLAQLRAYGSNHGRCGIQTLAWLAMLQG